MPKTTPSILLFSFVLSFFGTAQPIVERDSTALFQTHYSSKKYTVNDVEVLTQELEEFLQLDEFELILLHKKSSPVGTQHFLYSIGFKTIEIDQFAIKFNFNKEHQLVHFFLPQGFHSLVKSTNLPTQFSEVYPSNKHNLKEVRSSKKWSWIEQKLVPTVVIEGINTSGEHMAITESINGIIRQQQLSVNHHATETDTTIQGFAFLPDPITPTGESYGGMYSDNNDENNLQLTNARSPVESVGTFENDTFYLRNPYVQIHEHSFPIEPLVTSLNGQFDFTRDSTGFEQFMIVYHISNFAQYVENLGYLEVNYSIQADPHALNGSDNSSFSFFTFPPVLNFGIGGVDDAEDADVIIHEYGHALSYGITPGTNSGVERSAMDEAFGDYLAASHSKQFTAFDVDLVFNWDGHNEFWGGRSVATNDFYPTDLEGDIYLDADIWSAALMAIQNAIGRENTDRILFQSMYNYASNMSMSQAAALLIEADDLLFSGTYKNTICQILSQRGLLNNCELVSTGNEASENVTHPPKAFWNAHNEVVIKSAKNMRSITFISPVGTEIQSYVITGKEARLPAPKKLRWMIISGTYADETPFQIKVAH